MSGQRGYFNFALWKANRFEKSIAIFRKGFFRVSTLAVFYIHSHYVAQAFDVQPRPKWHRVKGLLQSLHPVVGRFVVLWASKPP